jgi:rod shape determining protein RodA
MPYLPFVGLEVNGARSWINLGFTTLQPSEIIKISFVLLMANYLTRNRDKLYTFKSIIMAALYAAPFILIVLKEDFGSAVVFIIMWIVMIFFAGIESRLFAKCAGLTLLFFPVAYSLLDDYQQERITAFIHPDNLALQGNYQVWQSKVAIGSGGFFVKAFFRVHKRIWISFLFEIPTSYSRWCGRTGFIGGAVLIAAYTWFIYAISKVAFAAKDLYGTLVVMGFLGMFVFQILKTLQCAWV